MKFISFEQIKSLNISAEKCYKWIENMIIEKNNMILPPKISMKPYDNVFCNVMPSIITDENSKMWGGVKIVTRYPDRLPSLESQILLMDMATGKNLALLDGTWITAMRTGAVAAHSIQLFSKKNYSTIGILGLGNTVRATMLMLLPNIRDRKIIVKLLKHKKQELDFISRFSYFENVVFSIVDNVEDVIGGSDVVISGVTYFEKDIVEDKFFDKGVFVLPIHTRGFMNCDLFFDKVYADDENHICHFKHFNKFNYFAEVCDVVNGNAIGRVNDDERIIAYNIGISIHDIYLASKIFSIIDNDSSNYQLQEFDMAQPKTKFWV